MEIDKEKGLIIPKNYLHSPNQDERPSNNIELGETFRYTIVFDARKNAISDVAIPGLDRFHIFSQQIQDDYRELNGNIISEQTKYSFDISLFYLWSDRLAKLLHCSLVKLSYFPIEHPTQLPNFHPISWRWPALTNPSFSCRATLFSFGNAITATNACTDVF